MRFLITLTLTTILLSCGRRVHLSEEEKAFNPYSIGDVLIFESSDKKLDTVIVSEISESVFPDAPGPLKYYNESLWVVSKNNGRILEVEAKTPDEEHGLLFNLNLKNVWSYGREMAFDEFSSLNTENLILNKRTYLDVLRIKGSDKYLDSREDAAAYIYWSKSEGYIKLEREDGYYWELVEKYNVND